MSEANEHDSGTTAVLDVPPEQTDIGSEAALNEASTTNEHALAEQEQPVATTEQPQAVPETEVDELRRKLADVTTQLDAKNRHELAVLRLEREVASRESVVNSLKEELKEAEETVGESNESTGPQLAHIDDPAGNTPLSQIGVTAAQCEKLMTVDPSIETVAQLEAFIAAGKFLPKSIKGIGNKALDTISDKLLEFRKANPNPNELHAPAVDGMWDATQFHAGQIAYADGKAASDNPNPDLSHAHNSWFAGWRKKQEESKQFRTKTPDQAIAECQAIQDRSCELQGVPVMCFLVEDVDETCEVYQPGIVNRSRKPCRCCSCARTINAGEQLLSIFTVFAGDVRVLKLCNQCCQDWCQIARVERIRGCHGNEWCQPYEVREVMSGHQELGRDNREDIGWPYWAPPATQRVDLKTIPGFLEHLKRWTT